METSLSEGCRRCLDESILLSLSASSPPNKRWQLQQSDSSDSEILDQSDLQEAIFLSEEEVEELLDQGSLPAARVSEFSDFQVFYPSDDDESANPHPDEPDSILMVQTDEREYDELQKIGRLLVDTYCNKLCLHHLTATDIITAKADYVSLTSSAARRLYLYNKLKEGSSESDPKSSHISTKYFIAGKEICDNSWAQIYGVSLRTLTRMLKQLSERKDGTHGNLGKRKVRTWMESYFDLIGDKMPDKNQIHLPSWESEKDIPYSWLFSKGFYFRIFRKGLPFRK